MEYNSLIQFSQQNARNQIDIFLTFFVPFTSLFSLIVYLGRFNGNNKRHFLTDVLTRVYNCTTYK